jgi:hypothetical protein
MEDNQTIRLYIAGHSGIGKSPLTRLFNVEGWEPFRVRVPRNDQDAKVCKTPEEARELENEYKERIPIYESIGNSTNQLRVYDEWSVFDVRGKSQWLNHTLAKDSNASLRIEIFAPVFAEMLEHREKIKEAFDLELDNILILLLNPTSMSFRDMKDPTHALSLATLTAITERSRLFGKGVDLADGLQRVEHLSGELSAWNKFYAIAPKNVVECKNWSHFEFRYSEPEATLTNAKFELIRAYSSVLKAIEKQAPNLFEKVKGILREPEQIINLPEVL